MQAIANNIIEQFLAQSTWELVAAILSVLYVWLAARQNQLCWLCAFISTAIFSWLFWDASLVFNTGLNLYYLVMAIVGYISWRDDPSNDFSAFLVTRLSVSQHLVVLTLGAFLTAALALLGEQWFNSQWLWLDAGVTVYSVLATVMTVKKILDNWYYWMAANACAAVLFYHTHLYFTALLMVVYLGMAIYGAREWQARHKQAVAVL